jgi:hypothetical protein
MARLLYATLADKMCSTASLNGWIDAKLQFSSHLCSILSGFTANEVCLNTVSMIMFSDNLSQMAIWETIYTFFYEIRLGKIVSSKKVINQLNYPMSHGTASLLYIPMSQSIYWDNYNVVVVCYDQC